MVKESHGPWHSFAERLFQSHGQDLSRVLVIVPEHFQPSTLRHALQQFNTPCLLPRIETLQSLSNSYQTRPNRVLNRQQSILLLANELQQFRSLYGKGSRWGLASDLYRLFSDLTRQQITLDSEADILSYIEQTEEETFVWLTRESKLVLTLWQAWHAQLEANDLEDADISYLKGLTAFLEHMPVSHLYWLESTTPDTCEMSWWEACKQKVPAERVSIQTDIADEAIRCRYITADSAENQALTVLAAIQRQLNNDKSRQIEVVTNDRKLVRRLQALLVRFDIVGDDKSGWGLSTTQAAACVEHWLNCIDQDFHYQAFLDFLKSPFSFPDIENKQRLTYLLEQDLVHRENIASNIDRYKHALISRSQRIKKPMGDDEADLMALLDRCQTYSDEMREYTYKMHPCDCLVDALTNNLQKMGIYTALEDDAAGLLVKQLLSEIPPNPELKMHWSDFRQWINLQLEQTSFRPSVAQSHVVFLNHTQALWGSQDTALRILCGMSPQHFPPRKTPVPFFGETIRTQLGLHLSHCNDALFSAYLDRQLASDCLLVWQSESDGEPLTPANDIERIFPSLAPHFDHDLRAWLPASNVAHHNDYVQPMPVASNLLKKSDSVTAQQRLINCPYLYFTHDLLNLGALDEISEALQKSDYGSRVHLCLEAFHHQVPGLPSPFQSPLSAHTKDSALAKLHEISEHVFSKDLSQHFEHQSWLSRWKKMIPSYLDWEISRSEHWQPQGFEKNISTTYPLRGRIDRLDKNQENIALVDYKTGTPPTKADIQSGEDIQLSTYAFAVSHVSSISYLSLGSGNKAKEVFLDGEELEHLIPDVESRYNALRAALKRGEKLPAWGEQEMCSRCYNAGICRRNLWAET